MARLEAAGREALTERWARALVEDAEPAYEPVPLARRHRLLGAGAELFYERPLHIVRGSGVWLYDAQGLAYLDVYNNVPHVGHAHPAVVAAIQKQTALLATHTRYLHARILEYAERLTATLPAHLDACMFVNSGSEANDVAWRLAKFATGRNGGIVMEHAYHGITDAVAALTPSTGRPRDARVVTLASPPAGATRDDDLSPAALEAAQDDVDRAVAALAERGTPPRHSSSTPPSQARASSIRRPRGARESRRACARRGASSSPTRCSTAWGAPDRICGGSSAAASSPTS